MILIQKKKKTKIKLINILYVGIHSLYKFGKLKDVISLLY